LDALARFMADHAEPADLLLRNKQLSDLIEQEVSQLPGRMREVYLLRRDEELSHAEIAERLGISRLTVKTQMNKALRILREKLSFFFLMLVILTFFIR
jgi:RNA polymerase sigma factor (sigma-70 family)